MRTLALLTAGLMLAWASAASAYSPLIETTRAQLPEHPSFSVSIRGEKDGQLDLLISVVKVDAKKALEQAAAPKPAEEPLDDDPTSKARIKRHFRDLNSVVIYVAEGEKVKPVVLWGFAFLGTYEEGAEDYTELLEGKLARGDKQITIPRELLNKAVLQFDCRKEGLLGPTYQVKLQEYLDEASQKFLKEKR